MVNNKKQPPAGELLPDWLDDALQSEEPPLADEAAYAAFASRFENNARQATAGLRKQQIRPVRQGWRGWALAGAGAAVIVLAALGIWHRIERPEPTVPPGQPDFPQQGKLIAYIPAIVTPGLQPGVKAGGLLLELEPNDTPDAAQALDGFTRDGGWYALQPGVLSGEETQDCFTGSPEFNAYTLTAEVHVQAPQETELELTLLDGTGKAVQYSALEPAANGGIVVSYNMPGGKFTAILAANGAEVQYELQLCARPVSTK